MLLLGLDTFGDVTLDADGAPLPQAQVLRHVVDEAVLADRGRPRWRSASASIIALISPSPRRKSCWRRSPRAPPHLLLGSAVTVLSTDDPVRVFQRFSTLNAVSNGRAEVILGRGSFTESFPLFGYDLAQYERAVRREAGALREAADGHAGRRGRDGRARRSRASRVSADRIGPPAHVGRRRRQPGVGRARRAARPAADARHHRRQPARFLPFVDLYRRSLARTRTHAAARSPCTHPATSPTTDEQASEELWPHYRGDDDAHRRRARLAAGLAHAIRSRGRAGWRAVRRIPGDGGGEDRGHGAHARAVALRHEVQQRHAAARSPDAHIELFGTRVASRVHELLGEA